MDFQHVVFRLDNDWNYLILNISSTLFLTTFSNSLRVIASFNTLKVEMFLSGTLDIDLCGLTWALALARQYLKQSYWRLLHNTYVPVNQRNVLDLLVFHLVPELSLQYNPRTVLFVRQLVFSNFLSKVPLW